MAEGNKDRLKCFSSPCSGCKQRCLVAIAVNVLRIVKSQGRHRSEHGAAPHLRVVAAVTARLTHDGNSLLVLHSGDTVVIKSQ